MSLQGILDELKATLATQLDIFGRATLEVQESSAIINKTQAAIAALEGSAIAPYNLPNSVPESVLRTSGYMQPLSQHQTEAEPGFFYDSDGVLRPNGWDNSLVATQAASVPAYILPPIPSDEFADSGDLLGLRG